MRVFLTEYGLNAPEFNMSQKPVIGLVGSWNAGKSTLTNALMSSPVAVTGDEPITKKRHKYELENFVVMDLPGSDARIEEVKEAKDALKEADIVIYVVDPSNIDMKVFWNDLSELSQLHIPFLVVINDRGSLNSSEKENREVHLLNFRHKLTDYPLIDLTMAEVFFVNARSAEKGRIENKGLLEERSGIIVLEKSILDLLSKDKLLIKNISEARKSIEQLDLLSKKLLKETSDSDTSEIHEALAEVGKVRVECLSISEEIISETAGPMKDAVFSLLSQGVIANDKDNGNRAQEITDLIQLHFEKAVDHFSSRCQPSIERLANRFDGLEVKWADINSSFSTDLGDLPHGYDEPVNIQESIKRVIDAAKLGSQLCEELSKLGAKEIGKQFASESTKKLAKDAGKAAAKHGSKAVAKATSNSVATTAGKIAGPLVTVLAGAWEFHIAIKKENAQRELIKGALMESEAKAKLLFSDVRNTFISRTNASVAQMLDHLENLLITKLRNSRDQNKELNSRIENIADLKRELVEVITHIGHSDANK